MRVGAVVRADRGGLGSMTYEFWRHVRPAATLVVDLSPDSRGPTDLDRYPGARVTPMRMSGEMDAFLSEVDVVWTAETVYDQRFPAVARTKDVPVVVHAMPELFRETRWTTVWAPTPWRLDLLPPGTPVLPVPVARDRLPYRRRTEADVFGHVAGEAMLDRNGTETVLAACSLVRRPCRLVVAGGPPGAWPDRVGAVEIVQRPPVRDYPDVIPDEVDVLLMPRRYGGLCLPVQEACARGIPSVMSDLPPNDLWTHPALRLHARETMTAAMKGGRLPVCEVAPAALAAVMDRLGGDAALIGEASDHAHAWAEVNSWEALLPTYLAALADLRPVG